MTLSKSQYIRALQCYKSIWLHKHAPELRTKPNKQQESLFNTGYQVGDYAKELFLGGVEVAFDADDFGGMAAKTKELIALKTPVIYEATFKEKNIFAMADILVLNDNGFYDIYEVKASTEVKEYHLNDAAIQYYALSGAINIGRVYIVHINNKYIKNGEIIPHELFSITDVTDEAKKRQCKIDDTLAEIESVLDGDMPNIDIGAHCSNPNECDFQNHCWAHVPKISIFNLYRINGSKKFELYKNKVLLLDDIPDDFKLTSTQKLQVGTLKSGEVHIDKAVIERFIQKVSYPINYFDFETFQNPIPRFDGQRPYMQIPFQYSLHIENENGEILHKEFLGDENSDPREALIKQMLRDITPHGSIMAYNQSFEISRIKELTLAFPAYHDELMALVPRFVDLIEPFRGLGYYHPAFNGSFSIKSVLPAMFANDPELDYKKLGSVQNGGDAMDVFANLYLLRDKSKREEIRADLLAYCKLDTLAMVRVFEKLKGIVL